MKKFYINGSEHLNIDYIIADDSTGKSKVNPIFPNDIEKFREVALTSLNFYMKKIGQSKADNVIASAKIDVLLVKAIESIGVDKSNWTKNEKNGWENMVALAKDGYCNSKSIVNATKGVIDAIAMAQERAVKIMSAKTHKEIYESL